MRVPSPWRDSIWSDEPISSARSRMNCRPKLRRGRGEPHDVEASAVVDDDEVIVFETDADRAGGRVLADVLEGLLHDAQDRCLGLRWDLGVDARTDTSTAIACLAVNSAAAAAIACFNPTSMEGGRRAADERADVVESVAQHRAQERELGPRRIG